MGDNADRENRRADELDKLPALFKEWLGVVGALGGAVAALLAVLLPQQTSARVQVIGYAGALALVCVGVFVFIRVRRRQRARERRERRRMAWEREAPGARLAAFRGLLPYQEGDELPGEHRRLEARRLVTQFSEPTFSFGVVCGDSGCGKTSLLRSEIQSSLKAGGEERGFGVHYLSNPRELADDALAGAHADAASRLRGELERLRQTATEVAGGRSLILIIDQFEEFFIEYADPGLRLELGRFLDGLIRSSPPVRVLCSVRRDYLADMKDLAPVDPDAARNFFEPLSLRGLFTLKNFTVEQAARVVAECAERDRIELDEEFAATLATDLGGGDSVRPPELQIVCTALGSNPTLAEYKLAGGARGILSRYIKDAIEVSGDPDTGRRVLLTLCDFLTHSKRNPQTVAEIAAEIAEAIGEEGPQAQALIRMVLRRFQGARLVVSERRGGKIGRRGGEKVEKSDEEETGYSLVHDYLVDAVLRATSDDDADELLAYYVSEYRTDPETRIPYHRLRFLRKYADRKKLADPTARRLLRASALRLVTMTAALVALVVIMTALLIAVTTTSRDVWHQQVVGNYWEGDDSGSVNNYVQAKRGIILSSASAVKADNNVNVWDVKTARMAYAFRHERFEWALPDYIFGYAESEKFATAFNIPARREALTTLPTQFLSALPNYSSDIGISASGTMISIEQEYDPFTNSGNTEERETRPSQPVRVFSLENNRLIGETPGCSRNVTNYDVTDDGEYVFALCMEGGAQRVTVFNVRTQEKKVLLREGSKATRDLVFDSRSGRLATLETSKDGRVALVLWDVRAGQIIGEPRDVNIRADSDGTVDAKLILTADGEYLYMELV